MPQTTQGQSRTSGGTYKTLLRTTQGWMKIFGRTDITLTVRTIVQNALGRTLSQSDSTSTITGDLQYDPKTMQEFIDLGVAQRGDGVLYIEGTTVLDLTNDLKSYLITVDSVTWTVLKQIEGEVVDGKVPYKGYVVRRSQ